MLLNKNNSKAFTLIELLLVLIIISVLTGVVIVVSKPTDILQKSRDSKRQSDLKKINTAVKLINENNPSFNLLSYLSTNTLYLSLKDSSSTCGNYLSQLPSLPSGWSYRCSATPTDITGQGWLPIPFSSNPLINISNLLIDPINKPPYYYTFTANDQGYELTAKKENKDEEIIVSNAPIRLTPISRGGTWVKTYSGGNSISSISLTSDGGYIVAGDTGGNYNYDILILKLDSSGNRQWAKRYGGNNIDIAYSISPISDGGYVVAGYTNSYGAGGDILILKLDSSGNLQWSKTYGGNNADYAYSISLTSNGGYIVAGKTLSYGAGSYDLLILKLDSSGNLQWSKTYGGNNEDVANSISPTSDGGYVVAGYTASYGSAGDILILKLDSSGNLQWSKTYGGTNSDFAYSISPISDGGYVVAGETYSYGAGGDILILKLDSSGNLQWSKTYGGSDWDVAHSISPTSDGGYIVAGNINGIKDFMANFDGLLLKFDSSNNLQWARAYLGDDDDRIFSISPTSDGGYIAAGSTGIYSLYIYLLVLKIDNLGSVNNCSLVQTINPNSSSPSISISSVAPFLGSPNPSSSSPSISSSSPSVSSQKICPL